MKITGAQAIVKCLENEGVEFIFGLCGHTNLALLDALRESSIEFISVRNEQVAAHAADAYYRFSHKPGVVLTTIGPGMSNAITGIMEAALDCSAVVLISGDVPSYFIGRDAFQELSMHSDASQWEIYKPFVKRSIRIPDLRMLTYNMHRAFNISQSGCPGPVMIDVPMNYFSEMMDFELPEMRKHRVTGTRTRGDYKEINKAVGLLLNSRRPLIHLGNGAVLSEAGVEAQSLAEYLGIPVTTSMIAQGVIPNNHPLVGGYPGAVGTPIGNYLAREADTVLAIGTRFSELEMSSWEPEYSFKFSKGEACLIQIDIQAEEIGRKYPVEVGIVGDAKTVLAEMLEVIKQKNKPNDWRSDPSNWLIQMQEQKKAWKKETEMHMASPDVPIQIPRLFNEVREALPEEGIIITDAGTFRHGVGQYITIFGSQTFFLPSGFGTMGGSMGAALGAKIAKPDRPVLTLVGDGGFSSLDSAVITAVEFDIPVVWVILNNYSYDSIKTYQNIYYKAFYGTDFISRTGIPYNPDFAGMAKAMGAQGEKVTKPEELQSVLHKAVSSNCPFVIDVEVAPTKLKATGYWDVAGILAKEVRESGRGT